MSTTTSNKTLRADKMKIRYRAEQLGLEPLGNHGHFTFIEETDDGPILWGHNLTNPEAVKTLHEVAQAKGINLPPVALRA